MSRGAVSGKLLFVSGVTPSVEPLLPLPTLSSYTVALVIPTTDTGIPLLFAVALARPTVFSTPIFHVISPTEYNSRVQRSSHNARMDSLALPDPRLLSFYRVRPRTSHAASTTLTSSGLLLCFSSSRLSAPRVCSLIWAAGENAELRWPFQRAKDRMRDR